MQFAINWSPEAADLLAEKAIQIDLFKCPDWEELVAKAQTQQASYIHFPLAIGIGQGADWDFDKIHHWLETTTTRCVNCHIIPSKDCFAEDVHLDDLIPILIAEVQSLVDEFGAERVIIENCPHDADKVSKGYLPQGIETRVFHEIIAATNCGFLLDMAHAALVADYLNWDFESYISALPVQHIREFHITGIGDWSTGIRGDHMPMTDDDWQRLDFCIQQFQSGKWRKPEVITFEYGGIAMLKDLCGSDKDVIAEQVPKLYQLAKRL